MKIEVIKDGQRTELDLRGLKGREVDAMIKELLKLQSASDDDQVDAYDQYVARQKEYACNVSGLSVDELDDLDSEDRAKIYDYINTKVQNSMGFLKPSQQ